MKQLLLPDDVLVHGASFDKIPGVKSCLRYTGGYTENPTKR